MRLPALCLPLLSVAAPLLAQSPGPAWDASTRARGWAFEDVDGSFLFLEPTRQEFIRWDPAAGMLGTRPAPTLEERQAEGAASADAEDPYSAAARLLYGERRPSAPRTAQVRRVFPDRWILDPKDHCWAAVGTTLLETDRQGQVLSKRRLPAPVSDIVRVGDGFYLCYRTLNPCVQKFNWRGDPVWTYQKKGPVPADTPLHRIVAHGEDSVLLASLGDLSFTVLGPGASGQVFFTRGGAVAEPLPVGKRGRAGMQYCPSRNAVLAVFNAPVPGVDQATGSGVVLACFNLAKGTLDWRPTGLGEGHQLIAVGAKGALFTSPAGGFAVVPVP